MPEHILALLVILFIATIVFAFAKQPVCEIIQHSDFTRRRNLWYAMTLAFFLAHNIWVYILIAGSLALFARFKESNHSALFFFLLFVVSGFSVQVPGMGFVNYLFALSHQRILALVIFLPAFITLATQRQTLTFGRNLPDKLLAAYLILIVLLYLRETSFTDTLRQALYQFIDVFLPYYVISRSLNKISDFREALLFFVIAVLILAAIGIFESIRHWLLYSSVENILDIKNRFAGYGSRAGLLRATATLKPIPFGYVMAVGIGFFLYLQRFIRSHFSRRLAFVALITGLLASLSRGPWVGAVFLCLVFLFTGTNPVRSLIKLGAASCIMLMMLLVLPGTDKIVDLLPFVGSSQQESISYREKLLENSLIVINRHPWFGSIDYLETPEMEEMRQGQGIIDIVNTYLRITLESGYVGFILFIGFFISICWGIYRGFKRLADKTSEEYLLGRSLLASLAAILLIIFTVSSGSIIPIIYWSVAGLGVAYINLVNQMRANRTLVVNNAA